MEHKEDIERGPVWLRNIAFKSQQVILELHVYIRRLCEEMHLVHLDAVEYSRKHGVGRFRKH